MRKNAVFVTEIISCALPRGVNVGVVVKIEPEFNDPVPEIRGFAGWGKIGQYPPVSAKNVIHITHQVIVVAVSPVVETVAAHVGAEFFIGSSTNFSTAIEAMTGFHFNKKLML